MESNKLNIEWKQIGNKVYFEYSGKEIYFIMPDGFKIYETHPDLIKVAEWLMFSPWYDLGLENYKFTRKRGKNSALNFSTGVDSTANLVIMPEDTHLIYVEREGLDDRMLKQENAIRMIAYLESKGRKVIRVPTNFEAIRTFHGLAIGYSTAIGMGVPCVLLADFLDLGLMAYGKVFDDQYFPKGVFRDYTKDYIVRQELLLNCGLLGFYPTVGCSEVITTQIVDNSDYKDYSFSCIRGKIGKQCNECYKCFRKNLLRNKPTNLDASSLYAITQDPPKMATSLTFALNKSSLNIKEVEYLKEYDVSMLSKVFTPAYDIYGEEAKSQILMRLRELGYLEMSEEEMKKLKELNFLRSIK